jgi:hypothetical protein
MVPIAWIFLLALSNRVELVNEDFQIAPADWKWVPIVAKQHTAMLTADYRVLAGPGDVRLVLMRGEDINEMPYGRLVQTEFARAGKLDHYLGDLGEYGLVVENRDSRAPAQVHLNVSLDFGSRATGVGTLSPRRQLSVIIISFAVFFGIVTWSAHRLLRAVRGG